MAAAAGLTVRTLHHYDEIGLLVPSERSDAGYRLYSDADVRRLYRILALRGMGFPLEEIAATLVREGEDPRPAVRRHLERIDEQLRLAGQLRARLTHILDVLDRADEPSGDQFIEAIEVMTRMERYYTPEQLEQLAERADALGEEGMRRAADEWAALIAEVEAERLAGTDPADPKLDPLVERWTGLIRQFTGGDPGIKASLQRLYDEEGPSGVARRGERRDDGLRAGRRWRRAAASASAARARRRRRRQPVGGDDGQAAAVRLGVERDEPGPVVVDGQHDLVGGAEAHLAGELLAPRRRRAVGVPGAPSTATAGGAVALDRAPIDAGVLLEREAQLLPRTSPSPRARRRRTRPSSRLRPARAS